MREKRAHSRRQIQLEVQYEWDGTTHRGTSADLSVGGMYVISETVPRFGAEISVSWTPPGTTEPLVLPGTVRWTKPDGFGVQFGLLGAKATHWITKTLKA